MPTYTFSTTWHIPASRDRVWNVIYDVEAWTSWWSSVKEARLVDQTSPDVQTGSTLFFTFKGFLPYLLNFTMNVSNIKTYETITGEARGDVDGIGTWTFSEQNGETIVIYEWKVSLTKSWMKIFSPLLRPVFQWNHDYVMKQGENGLKRLMTTHNTPTHSNTFQRT